MAVGYFPHVRTDLLNGGHERYGQELVARVCPRIAAALRARSSTSDGVIKNQDEHRPNHSNEQAIQVYTRDAVRSEHAEHPAPNYGANDSQHDIEDYPFATLVH
jgi:hypothetical protein